MYEVLGFYKFISLSNLKKNKKFLQKFLIKNKIRGTIIISNEGINGTISGKSKYIKTLINKLKKIFIFKNFDSSNKSKTLLKPFHRAKVKIKKEIVPMNLTFADAPSMVLSVTVTVFVPVPVIFPDILTRSPWEPLPPPAVNIESA